MKTFYQTYLTATMYPDTDIKTTLYNDVIHYDKEDAEKLLSSWIQKTREAGMVILDNGIQELRVL